PKDTGNNEEREKKLLDRSPPGNEGTKFVDMPATVLDVTGAIIMWYLPGALTDTTQEEIWKASQLLTPTLEKSVKVSGSRRTNEDDIAAGCINISPTWFQQGHERLIDPLVMSESYNSKEVQKWLGALTTSELLWNSITAAVAPELFESGSSAFSKV
ncbi:uncharacterized protein EDB91DRAFT_1006960, partial [Suillus paluster]|uniref:uncharacterized protein n=1 Tax=Suillus paluster TaxID=48578 RepID=UPI001B876D1D